MNIYTEPKFKHCKISCRLMTYKITVLTFPTFKNIHNRVAVRTVKCHPQFSFVCIERVLSYRRVSSYTHEVKFLYTDIHTKTGTL